MNASDIIAVVGTALTAAAVVIAYLQLRVARTDSMHDAPAASLPALAAELSLFAPKARYLGFDVDLVDRHAESAALLQLVRGGRSVVAVEGISAQPDLFLGHPHEPQAHA